MVYPAPLLDGVAAGFNVAAARPAGGGRGGAPRAALLAWAQAQGPAALGGGAVARQGSMGSEPGGGGGGGSSQMGE